jgi:uncharacterized protein YlxW (UPF0749 family)
MTPPEAGPEPTGPPRRPDASMTLLTTMLERPLDPGYAAAADRRTAAGKPAATSLRSPRLVLACLLIGLMVGVASYNLTGPDTPRSKAREDLIEQIQTRRGQVDELTGRATALQAEVSGLQSARLGGDALSTRSRELAAVVGAVPLEGPGLVLTIDDAPGSGVDDPPDTTSDEAAEGRVLARDLQFVTNALWEAGAEALSINGKRLTSTSSIRFAGSAIIVDSRPLARPYVITALGDPKGFPAAFADGPGGTYLSTLRSNYGVRVDTEVSKDLTVPAAVRLTTRYATTGNTEGASPSATPSTERSPS